MTHTDFIIDLVLGGLLVFSLLLKRIPKKYIGSFWDFIRKNYHEHIFGGALIGMGLSTTFIGVFEGMQIFLTLVISGALGTLWEWGWGAYNGTQPDYNDVYFAMAAATIAVITHM